MPILNKTLPCGQYIDDRTHYVAPLIGAKRTASARAMFDRPRNDSSAQIFTKASYLLSGNGRQRVQGIAVDKILGRGVQVKQLGQSFEVFPRSFTSAIDLISKFCRMETSFNDQICCALK